MDVYRKLFHKITKNYSAFKAAPNLKLRYVLNSALFPGKGGFRLPDWVP